MFVPWFETFCLHLYDGMELQISSLSLSLYIYIYIYIYRERERERERGKQHISLFLKEIFKSRFHICEVIFLESYPRKSKVVDQILFYIIH